MTVPGKRADPKVRRSGYRSIRPADHPGGPWIGHSNAAGMVDLGPHPLAVTYAPTGPAPPAPKPTPVPTVVIHPTYSSKRRIGQVGVLRLDDAEVPPPWVEERPLPGPPDAAPAVATVRHVPMRAEDCLPYVPEGTRAIEGIPPVNAGEQAERTAAWGEAFGGVMFGAPLVAGSLVLPPSTPIVLTHQEGIGQ